MPTVIIKQKTLRLARICLPLFQDARRSAIVHDVSDRPTDSTALAFVFDRLRAFELSGGKVLWDVLVSLSPARFNIPSSFDCDIRYATTLTGGKLLSQVDAFRDVLSALPAFSSESRGVYKNFAVRAALMFGYAIEHEKDFRDVLIVAGTDAEDNPTAFDPSIFDSPALVPSDTDRILNRAAMDVLYPNGIVDADGTAVEGYVDESDLL